MNNKRGFLCSRQPLERLWRSTCVLVGASGLAACAVSPGTAPPPPPAPSVPAVVVAPPAEPAPPAPPVETPAPPPTSAAPMSAQDIQRALLSSMESLQAGQEDAAETELKRVLQAEPNNRQALSLMRQIKDDPIAALGRESFAYRVQPGESLSRIAQRFLNDLQQFYILARYNGIKVPRSLAEGQTIRIPGKAPPNMAGSSPAPTPAPASAEAAVDPAAAERQRAELIARHTREARGSFAKQDLDAAIRSWEAVLKLDPDNRTAFLEREKIIGLKEKLVKLK
jgi:hypothetical protein